MKKYLPIITALVVTLSANAQNANTIDSVVSANAFINLPLQPHQKNVDIFFNCDKPKQPFYNIKVIDVQGGNSYQELLNKMQETARNEGFDGMIILGKSNYLTQDNRATTAIISGLAQGTAAAIAGKNDDDYRHYDPAFTSVNVLSAIGIKYKNNMQYVDRIVKRAFVQLKDASNKVDTVNFTLNSELIKDNSYGIRFYEENVRLFDVCDYYSTHKMPESATRNYNEAEFSTTIKVDNPFSDGNIRYKVFYANDSTLNKVQIRIPSNDAQTDAKIYDVVYDLNKDKTINKRFVRLGRKVELLFTDSYQYGTNNRCTGFTRYDEKAKAVVLQVNFEYFTVNDLPKIL
jgi:hypothetical protein